MLNRYTVIGVVQVCLFGQWREQAMSVVVLAATPASAITAALDLHKREALAADSHAIVRWHTPELVRAIDQTSAITAS